MLSDLLLRVERARTCRATCIGFEARYFSSADQLLTLRMFDVTPSAESWAFAAEHDFDVVAEMGMWIPDLDGLLANGLMREGTPTTIARV